jgi:hypothetical protein
LSTVEQEFYLAAVADEHVMRPETFAQLLRAYLGPQPLDAHDLVSRPVGKNLVVNKFQDVAEFVGGIVEICSKAVQTHGINISFTSAIELMLAYGTVEHVEAILDSIVSDLEDICEALGYDNMSDARAIEAAVLHLVNQILPACKLRGRPTPNRFMEALEEGGYRPYESPREE